MKVIKKFNNNVALCLDNNNCEVIAIGTGIGFHTLPYEIEDMGKIERTFYGVNSRYIELINEIPEKIFIVTALIVDYASTLIKHTLSTNLPFTLADHINFAIKRHTNNIPVRLTIYNDIRHLHKSEVKVGEYALALIKEELNVDLFSDEALGIAMHIINSYVVPTTDSQKEVESIDRITKIIEADFKILVDRNTVSYARFVSHMEYFLRVSHGSQGLKSTNIKMLSSMQKEYPEAYNCGKKIIAFVEDELNWEPNNEELLYIMLHINRLCAREDCYQ